MRVDTRPHPNHFAVSADEPTLQRTAERLRAGGFNVEVLVDAEAARARITELVPPGMSVFTGTSETRVLIFNGEPFGRVTILLLREAIGY